MLQRDSLLYLADGLQCNCFSNSRTFPPTLGILALYSPRWASIHVDIPVEVSRKNPQSKWPISSYGLPGKNSGGQHPHRGFQKRSTIQVAHITQRVSRSTSKCRTTLAPDIKILWSDRSDYTSGVSEGFPDSWHSCSTKN